MDGLRRRTGAGTQQVSTSSGVLSGTRDGEILAFHGIPYAAAPTGAKRFRPPEPAHPWTGVRPAREPGFVAPQVPTPLEDLYGRPGAVQGEDCLTLSVWTPGLDDARRPVVVWIHGGNFVNGSGCTPRTDGTTLARVGDVVVVGVNYRSGRPPRIPSDGIIGDGSAPARHIS